MVYHISTITSSGKKTLLSFPSDQKSKAFVNAFDLPFNSLFVPENPKPVEIGLSIYGHRQWEIGMMWLAKDYFKLWKVTDPPFCEPEVQAYQHFGDKLIALVNLCNWTLDYVPELSNDSPLDFAGKILLELKKVTLARSHYYQGRRGTSQLNKIAAKGLANLKNWINPYCPVQTPQTFNLISAAIRVAKPNNDHENKRVKKGQTRYYEKAWKPYLNAVRDWNTDVRDGVDVGRGQRVTFGAPQIKGDAIVIPSPKKGGKGFVTIYKVRKKTLSGRGRKSNAKSKITLAVKELQRLESEF